MGTGGARPRQVAVSPGQRHLCTADFAGPQDAGNLPSLTQLSAHCTPGMEGCALLCILLPLNLTRAYHVSQTITSKSIKSMSKSNF